VLLGDLLGLSHRADNADVVQRIAKANRIVGILDSGGSPHPGLQIDPGVLSRTGHEDEVTLPEARDVLGIASVERVCLARLGY
jgi:hypothetical protein